MNDPPDVAPRAVDPAPSEVLDLLESAARSAAGHLAGLGTRACLAAGARRGAGGAGRWCFAGGGAFRRRAARGGRGAGAGVSDGQRASGVLRLGQRGSASGRDRGRAAGGGGQPVVRGRGPCGRLPGARGGALDRGAGGLPACAGGRAADLRRVHGDDRGDRGGAAACAVAAGVGRVRRDGLNGAPRLVGYAGAEVHSCVRKAIELLGIGTANLRWWRTTVLGIWIRGRCGRR
jgi:hypothetical protein